MEHRETADAVVGDAPGEPVNYEEEIRGWATLQFGEDEIAELLGLDDGQALRLFDESDDWGIAVRQGHLRGEAAVRSALMEAVRGGSVPAAKVFGDLIAQRREGA